MLGRSMETSANLMGVTEWIPATVPGGVHFDLYRAGIIDHPYRDCDSVKCEWVERRWWLYRTTVCRPAYTGQKLEFYFAGLDYEVSIYANEKHLGDHRGMFRPFAVDVTDLFAESDRIELKLLFRGVPDEMGQIGLTSRTFTQKSRFGYKWDFSTRLVNIGIWGDAVLRVHEAWSFGEISVHSDVNHGTGEIHLSIELENRGDDGSNSPAVDIRMVDPENQTVLSRVLPVDSAGRAATVLRLSNPRLWYPNGYGEQPLYRLDLSLTDGTRLFDERTQYVGIRKLSYSRNEGGPDDALPYTFIVNGRRLHIQGVNLTPLDHLYGNVTPGHYEWYVRCMRESHVNLVRVWGGGVIEREVFYDLCDRHGILVWQEFIQSSSGVDNIPSQRPEFLNLLKETANASLKTRRNHTCLAVWSGGNELMESPNVPSKLSDTNLAMLRDLVREHDPHRLFLPTSASGPVEYVTPQRGVMHDVHGHWKYQGVRTHYELYGEADSLFHSEFGVDGCSDLRSLSKFLSQEHRQPTTMVKSLVWRHHGEWWDTADRVKEFFGQIDELGMFVDCSQWIQAEGLRFILEANRRHQPRNSGSIIWQLNEPWPNVSCTNLIDYYGEKKMAFYWTRLAFEDLHPSLDYRQLVHSRGTLFHGRVYLHQRGSARAVSLRVEVLGLDGCRFIDRAQTMEIAESGAIECDPVKFVIEEKHGKMFFVRLSAVGIEAAQPTENLYTFSTGETEYFAAALAQKPEELAVSTLCEWVNSSDATWRRSFLVENRGTKVALFLRPEEMTNAWWLEADSAYVSLFPNESRIVDICCRPKSAGGFLMDDQPAAGGEPVIRFRQWGGVITNSL